MRVAPLSQRSIICARSVARNICGGLGVAEMTNWVSAAAAAAADRFVTESSAFVAGDAPETNLGRWKSPRASRLITYLHNMGNKTQFALNVVHSERRRGTIFAMRECDRERRGEKVYHEYNEPGGARVDSARWTRWARVARGDEILLIMDARSLPGGATGWCASAECPRNQYNEIIKFSRDATLTADYFVFLCHWHWSTPKIILFSCKHIFVLLTRQKIIL